MSQILNYSFKFIKHCLSRHLHYFIILGPPPLATKAPPWRDEGGALAPPSLKNVWKPDFCTRYRMQNSQSLVLWGWGGTKGS